MSFNSCIMHQINPTGPIITLSSAMPTPTQSTNLCEPPKVKLMFLHVITALLHRFGLSVGRLLHATPLLLIIGIRLQNVVTTSPASQVCWCYRHSSIHPKHASRWYCKDWHFICLLVHQLLVVTLSMYCSCARLTQE